MIWTIHMAPQSDDGKSRPNFLDYFSQYSFVKWKFGQVYFYFLYVTVTIGNGTSYNTNLPTHLAPTSVKLKQGLEHLQVPTYFYTVQCTYLRSYLRTKISKFYSLKFIKKSIQVGTTEDDINFFFCISIFNCLVSRLSTDFLGCKN